jgi:small conductance mechanosensitive channel
MAIALGIFPASIGKGLTQDNAPAVKPTAVTTADPAVLPDNLAILVKPLTEEDLVVESEGWRDLLKQHVQQIADLRIAVKNGEANAESLLPLQAEKTRLVDNLNVVLDELEAKGGDVATFRKYVAALSGVAIEVADTDSAWTMLRGWLASEQGGMRWLVNFGKFFAILIAFFFVSRIVANIVVHAAKRLEKSSELLTNFLGNFVRQAIMLIGLIVALAALEVNIGPLLAAVGAAGFIMAFALQNTLSNFASGLLILAYRPFDVGDAVEAGGVSGSVKSVSLFSTHITTPDNKLMIVPNNDIWGRTITNATASDMRRVDMLFGIGYGDDIDKAKNLLESVLAQHALVLDEPPPVVRLHELGDSSVNFICRPWTRSENYWTVYWDVTRAVKVEFDRNHISFPFPQRDIHVYQESGTAG